MPRKPDGTARKHHNTMTQQPQHLIASLREGLCIENDRCRVRNAASGCDCAIIADFIEGQAAEIERLGLEVEELRAEVELWKDREASQRQALDETIKHYDEMLDLRW